MIDGFEDNGDGMVLAYCSQVAWMATGDESLWLLILLLFCSAKRNERLHLENRRKEE